MKLLIFLPLILDRCIKNYLWYSADIEWWQDSIYDIFQSDIFICISELKLNLRLGPDNFQKISGHL